MKKSLISIAVVAAVMGCGFFVWQASRAGQAVADGRPGGTERPVPVTVTTARVQPMPVVLDGIGAVEPEQSVQVRPQVSGVITKVFFHEGDAVKAGQPLFQIDPRAYQAAAAQAQAALARDLAGAQEAQAQADRLAPLAKSEYVTRQEYAQAVATAHSNAATVKADREALKQARLQLEFATIRAPISGRAGALQVKAGNLVAADSPTPLVTINCIAPALVDFTIPQQALPEVQQAIKASRVLPADISRVKGQPAVAHGQLVFIDNAVNQQAGTVTVKVRADNSDEALWPGQFVAVRLTERMQPRAVVVPANAVQTGQQGAFVYVAEDGRARMRHVTLDRQVDDLAVISHGLAGSEQVITQFPANMQDGAPVKIAAASGGQGSQQ